MLTVEKDKWAYDRERAMSPSSLSSKTHAARKMTRLHLSNQPEAVATCFVFNDCGDDSGTLADTADQIVLLPKESIGQTFLIPTASTASTAANNKTDDISDVCAANNDDELWLIETDYTSG